MNRTLIPARPAVLTALSLIGVALSGCSQVTNLPDERGGLGSNLGALRNLTLRLDNLMQQSDLVDRLNGVQAVGGTPAIPGLSQILSTPPVIPANNTAARQYAPNIAHQTALLSANPNSPSCTQVLVTDSSTSSNPGPMTLQPVTLVFNDNSLYLEGFQRGNMYFYFNDNNGTLPCTRHFVNNKILPFSSNHLENKYDTSYYNVKKAIGVLQISSSDKVYGAVQTALDQMSFVTSEALRFSTVMTAVINSGPVSKALNPEINSWGQASTVYATLLANNALPTPAPDDNVKKSLSLMSTLKRQ